MPKGSEKRLRRYRSKPTKQNALRIERAKTQPLFLIKTSEVIPSTGHSGPLITFSPRPGINWQRLRGITIQKS